MKISRLMPFSFSCAKPIGFAALFGFALLGGKTLSAAPQAQAPAAAALPAAQAPAAADAEKWTLAWSDEFSDSDGSQPDYQKWEIMTGGNGWGNDEQQFYTGRAKNLFIENGNLEITAYRERYISGAITRDFTSAKIGTNGLFAQKYGRFEARLKLPKGQGLWPAFRLLGEDKEKAGWPAQGGITVAEMAGSEPAKIRGGLEGAGYSGTGAPGASYTLPGGKTFADDFHVFAVEWEPETIRWYVDGQLYQTLTAASLPSGAKWVFDRPFYLVLSLAIGGRLPGNPDGTTGFPATLLVDYVRVYTRK